MSSLIRQSFRLLEKRFYNHGPLFKQSSLNGSGSAAALTWTRYSSSMKNWDPAQFKPRKAVILTKVSRYEYEKLQNDSLSERQLEEMLTKA